MLAAFSASADQAAARYDFMCPPSSVWQTSLFFARSITGGSSLSRTGGRWSRPVWPRRLLYQSAPIFRRWSRCFSLTTQNAFRTSCLSVWITRRLATAPAQVANSRELSSVLDLLRLATAAVLLTKVRDRRWSGLLTSFSVTRHTQSTPTELVSNSVSSVLSGFYENPVFEKVRYQGWYGEGKNVFWDQ